MLVIRMQRTGRKGHAQFRVVVQDSRRTPTSGKIVARLGHFNPHSKQTVIDKEKAQFYLDHGAQPSERAARLLKAEGVKLPAWVKLADKKSGKIRNPEKLRRNRPAEEATKEAEATEEPSTPAEEAEVAASEEQPASAEPAPEAKPAPAAEASKEDAEATEPKAE